MGSTLHNITRREFFGFLAALGMPGLWAGNSEGQTAQSHTTNQSVEEYYNSAMSKLSRGEEKDGLEMLLEMDKRFPSSPDAHFIAANACLIDMRRASNEKCINALRKYDRAIELDDKMAEAYVNRGLLHCVMVGPSDEDLLEIWSPVDKVDFEEPYELPPIWGYLLSLKAIPDIDKAIELKPNLFSAHFNKGQLLYYLGKYQEAVEEFSKAIKIGLKNEDWSDYVPAFEDEKRTESLIGVNPFSIVGAIPKYAKDRGSTYKVGKDRLVVLSPYLVYLQNQNEPLAFAYFHRGVCYAQPPLRNYADSIGDISEAIRLNPNVIRFYLQLAIAQHVTGKYEDVNSTTEKCRALLKRITGLCTQMQQEIEPKQ